MGRPKKTENAEIAEKPAAEKATIAENATVQAPKKRGRPPKDPAKTAARKATIRISRKFLNQVKEEQDQRIQENKEIRARKKKEIQAQKKEAEKRPVKTEEQKAKIAARNKKVNEIIAQKPKIFGQVTKKPKEINMQLVSQCAALGMTQAETASYVGLNKVSFYERMKKDAELQEAWEKGLSQGTFKAASMLMEMIEEKCPQAIFFYLKCKAGWSEKQEVNVNGSIEHQINLKEMTDDQLLKLVGDEAGELD